jgi:hypothetical protein
MLHLESRELRNQAKRLRQQRAALMTDATTQSGDAEFVHFDVGSATG